MIQALAIVRYLESLGLGELGVDTFIGLKSTLPNLKPEQVGPFVTIVETGGLGPLGTHNEGKTAYRRPWFQLVIRHKSPFLAREKADQLYLALATENKLMGDLRFVNVTPLQEPFPLGPDDKGFDRMAFNISSTHHR